MRKGLRNEADERSKPAQIPFKFNRFKGKSKAQLGFGLGGAAGFSAAAVFVGWVLFEEASALVAASGA
jgi:hypothetical protein